VKQNIDLSKSRDLRNECVEIPGLFGNETNNLINTNWMLERLQQTNKQSKTE